ncbi:MAG TPA: glycine cleavage system aminomethyltransferase GcvT [Candidatus Binatia bacterium]|nr:glycine cleavage system aminomethyltransferase GcvT [Candidatus Binatia bacterium]
MKRTPLFDAHQRLGGRLIEFGGWEMPVQYTSIVDEHLAVRNAAGLFDISHMGEIFVRGPGAEAYLNHSLTNDARKLAVGQGQYTLMCNERGGVIDDLYVYRLGPDEYLLIVNASRIEEDTAWLEGQLTTFPRREATRLQNASDTTGAVALQGPRVAGFIDQCFPGVSVAGTPVKEASELKKNQIAKFDFPGTQVWVSRTGYTGEDGFEIVAPAGSIEALWNHLLSIGQPQGLKPAGLGARDTLRTEVCYPLYGHELDEDTTPLEAGLGFFVALDKDDFVGRPVLAEQKAKGVAKKLVALKMTGKSAPPRPHYPVWSSGAHIGQVVSGTQSPSLGTGIGLAYVPPEFAKPQTPLEIEIRGNRAPAVVVPKPIYRKAD